MMQAAVVSDSGGVNFAEIERPSEPRPGWVLLRVAYCGICGSDLHFLGSPLAPAGLVMGHELTGIVDSVGAGVSALSEGDRVVVLPAERCSPGDEQCPSCAEGATQRCHRQQSTSIGIVIPGGFAEYVEVPASSCFVLSDESSLQVAALCEPLAVALHAMGASRFQPGMDVAVIGAGPIGLLTIAALRHLGAGEVGVSEPSPYRANLAASLGATTVVDRATRLSTTMAKSPEIVFECAGRSGTPGEAIGLVRPGGEVILAGVADPAEMLKISSIIWVVKEVSVQGVIAYTTEEFGKAVELIESVEFDPSLVISEIRPLSRAGESFAELMGPNEQAKILLSVDANEN